MLVKEYEPRVGARSVAQLSALWTPKFHDATFLQEWRAWERQVMMYEEQETDPLTQRLKCAVISRWAPPIIQTFLKQCPLDVSDDYAGLRDGIGLF